MNEFKVGQEVTMFVNGAGVTSKEKHKIKSVEKGIVILDNSEKQFDLTGKCTEMDNIFGFEFWIL